MEVVPGPRPGLCCKPGRRLDMSRGFTHHIRRSQFAHSRALTTAAHWPAPGLAAAVNLSPIPTSAT
uniref:Uncharacterized protein n=1 Tax=Balaenoptera musculus TaxID=9771 RepID=A0A8C0CKL8_BALMU